MSAARALLAEAAATGTALWTEGRKIRWRGDPSPELLDRLRQSKGGIREELEAEEERLQAAGERAVRGVIATSDEGELLREGEP